MITLPCGAFASAARVDNCDDGMADAAARAAPGGGTALPRVLPVAPAVPAADAAVDVSRSPAPQKRHAVDGLHCDQCMPAVATAATTRTTITPAAIRPALLEWITMYLDGSELQRDCQAPR